MIVSKAIDHLFGHGSIKEADEFCAQLLALRPSRIFLTALWEAHEFQSVIAYIDEFLYKQGIPTTWVLNAFVVPNPAWNNLCCQTVLFDFCLWRVYNEIVNKQKSPINPDWNPDSTHCLFLTGKPFKINRIRLLYKLEKSGLLDRCNYSFFMSPGMQDMSKTFVPELSQEEFENFIQAHAGKSPDNAKVVDQGCSVHYGGIPYNPKIYAESLVSLIPETTMYFSIPFITEKTWLSIVNNCPFIIAGDVNSCRYLESINIHTFDNLFDIPTYDNIRSPEARLNKIVAHVDQWLKGNFNKKIVADMVKENYNQYSVLANEARQKFESAVDCDIDLAIDTRDDITKF